MLNKPKQNPVTPDDNNLAEGIVDGETNSTSSTKAKDDSKKKEDDAKSEYKMNVLHVMFPLFGMLYH